MREFVIRMGETNNAYALHQKVWEVVRKTLRDGTHFVFREAGGYVKVRHDAGDVGRPCLVPETGKRYRFDVLINPVRSSSVVDKKIPVTTHQEAIAIVKRYLERHGFSVISLDGDFVPGKMFGKPGLKNFRMRSFLAYGEVLVIDGEKAKVAMRDGIGASKRFGFGMIDLEEIP